MPPKKHLWIFTAVMITAALLSLLLGNPMVYVNNARLKAALADLPQDTVTLEEAVPFHWTTVFTFDPYTPLSVIREVTGSDSPALKESVSEGMTHLVFVHNGRVVCSVCAYPQSVGYDVAFHSGPSTTCPCLSGGYSRLDYGDGAAFTVTQENGFVRLNAVAES